MKNVMRAVGLLIFFILLFASGQVYADKDDDDRYEVLEDVGEMIGWGIVAMGVAAGSLFPLRRYFYAIVVRMPSIRDKYRKGLRFLAKLHPLIGSISLSLSIVHGLLMYINEGELGGTEWLGIIAVVLLALASSFGIQLSKKKKNFKQVRKYHIMLLLLVAVLAGVHIALD